MNKARCIDLLMCDLPARALDTTQWCRAACSETFGLYPEKTSQYQSDGLGFWCFTITVRPGSTSREDAVFCPMTAGMSFSWGSTTEPCYYEGTVLTTPVSVLDSRIMHSLPWLCVLQYVQPMALVKHAAVLIHVQYPIKINIAVIEFPRIVVVFMFLLKARNWKEKKLLGQQKTFFMWTQGQCGL